jgi:DnaK suppressor protein
MPDTLDLAKDVEMHQRDQALKRALSRKDPTQQVINPQELCIDCDDVVSAARLTAKPKAARCIDCQQIWEHKYDQR